MLALAILPVLALRGLGSEAEIRGGLFQDFAPSVFHLTHVLLPMLAQMGMAAEVDLVRPGYVPAGGGIIRVAVPPAAGPLRPLAPRRGETPARVWGISLASHLGGRRVPARMAAAARSVLAAAGISAAIQERSDSTAAQAGAAFALFADFIGGTRLGADRAGAPHRPAESIGAQVAHRLLGEISSGATIDRHASDQIIPYAALAEAGPVTPMTYSTPAGPGHRPHRPAAHPHRGHASPSPTTQEAGRAGATASRAGWKRCPGGRRSRQHRRSALCA